MFNRKVLTGLLAVTMALFVAAPFVSSEAYAITSVTATGGENVKAGDEFTINVKFTGDDVSTVEGQIGFDGSVLEYVSGGSNAGDGFIEINKSGGKGEVAFDIKFKALEGGSTGIDISSSAIYDYNKNKLDDCAYSMIIKIAGDKADGEQADDNVVHETSTKAMPYDEKNADKGGSPVPLIIGIIAAALVIIVIIIAVTRKKKSNK